MDKRVIELALEALEQRKSTIDAEIAAIRAQLAGSPKKAAAPAKSPKTGRRAPKSKAAKKAISDRMKIYWQKKKAAQAAAGKEENSAKKKK